MSGTCNREESDTQTTFTLNFQKLCLKTFVLLLVVVMTGL